MGKLLWVALFAFIAFEVWVSIGYLSVGKLTLGVFSTFWTLLTVRAVGDLYFERLDHQRIKQPSCTEKERTGS
jgi:hypothetical protein